MKKEIEELYPDRESALARERERESWMSSFFLSRQWIRGGDGKVKEEVENRGIQKNC